MFMITAGTKNKIKVECIEYLDYFQFIEIFLKILENENFKSILIFN